MSRGWILLILASCALGAWNWWQGRALPLPAGVEYAPDAPRQTPLSGKASPIVFGGYQLQPRANFQMTARLLRRERYHLGREARIAPLDFALGWGPMSDSALLDRVQLRQSGRFYHVAWADAALSADRILRNSANVHMIPADATVARALNRMRPGHILRLDGLLVDVQGKDGWEWRTSLRRDDSGDGACELFWVRLAHVIK